MNEMGKKGKRNFWHRKRNEALKSRKMCEAIRANLQHDENC